MKHLLILSVFLLTQFNFGQVGIGTTNPNGLLDMTSASPSAPITTDGLLIPRVLAFPSPVGVAQNGMMVFLTTAFAGNKIGIYYYDFPTLTWKWVTTGNNGNIWSYNNASSRIELPFQSDGTTARPLGNEITILDNGNVGFGTLNPLRNLQVTRDINNGTKFSVSNPNAGTNAFSQITAETLGAISYLYSINTGYVFDPLYPWFKASNSLLQGTGAGGLSLAATDPSGFMNFFTGGTDESMRITTTGNVGIGLKIPATKLDVSGATNVSKGYFYGGTVSPSDLELTRTLSTVVNNTIEIGNFNTTNGTHSFRLSVTASIPNFSVSKSYIVSCKYNQTSNVWQMLQPTANTGAFAATDDFEVDIKVDNAITSLRLRKSLGVIGGDIQIRLESTGATTDVFAGTSATATVTAPTVIFAANAVPNNWTITGNANTIDGTNFIGTTDNIPLNFRVNNSKSGRISSTGETFFGFEAGKNNSNSGITTNNTGFGYRAFASNTTTGRDNTAIGQTALTANNGGSFNTALGSGALKTNITGNYNTSVGKDALSSSIGDYNTAMGWESLISNTSGIRNIGLGVRTLRYYTTNNDNIAIGYESMVGGSGTVTSTAINNVAVGNNAMNVNISGAENSAFGNDALKLNSSGSQNAAFGFQSLNANTTGLENCSFGNIAMKFNTTGSQNSAFGFQSLNGNTTGSENTAIGRKAMQLNATGSQNTAVGFNALFSNTANNNTGVGRNASYSNTSGTNNTSIGFNSLFANASGSNNTAIGYNAGQNITTGSNNIIIGSNINIPTSTLSDQMNIGNGIYGLTMTSTATAKIGIGTTNPGTRFQVGLDHATPNIGGMVQVNLNDADSQSQGIKTSVNRTSGANYAINGTAFGIGATTNYGLYGYATGATGKNWGLYVDEGDAYVKGAVAVGTITPNASAILDLSTTNKGLLLPRMTKAQRDLITKVAGLMIYQTDNISGLRVCDGTNWKRFTETND